MKKLNYQLYIAGAGKAQTKDDNNLYLDGEFEGTKIKSVTSIATESETLLEKPDVDEDLIEYLEQHPEIGIEDGKMVEYRQLSWLDKFHYPVYFDDGHVSIVWGASTTEPIGDIVSGVCIVMKTGSSYIKVDTRYGPPPTKITFKKDFKAVINIALNALVIPDEYYDSEPYE